MENPPTHPEPVCAYTRGRRGEQNRLEVGGRGDHLQIEGRFLKAVLKKTKAGFLEGGGGGERYILTTVED